MKKDGTYKGLKEKPWGAAPEHSSSEMNKIKFKESKESKAPAQYKKKAFTAS